MAPRHGDAPAEAVGAGRETDGRDNLIVADAGPGCGHDCCAFVRACLLDQLEAEILDEIQDREQRRARGRELAHALGLGDDEGRLLEVIAYSSDISCRIAAGELLVDALERLAHAEAA